MFARRTAYRCPTEYTLDTASERTPPGRGNGSRSHKKKERQMISELRFKNLKSFSSSGQIECAPITLLMGENSQGKSSVIQAALLMQQNFELAKPLFEEYTQIEFSGPSIDLGSFGAAIHNHDPERVLRLGFTFKHHERMLFRTRSINPLFGRIVSIDIAIRAGASGRGEASSYQLRFAQHTINLVSETKDKSTGVFPDTSNDIASLIDIWRGARSKSDEGSEIFEDLEEDDFKWMRTWLLKTPMDGGFVTPCWDAEEISARRPGRPIGGRLDSPRRIALERFVLDWQIWASNLDSEISQQWRMTKHVAALRRTPDRLMLDTGSHFDSLGPAGEGLVRILANDNALLDRLNSSLASMGIEYKVGVTSSTLGTSGQDLGEVSVLSLVDTASDTVLTLADVGVGISQVIPVLMHALVSVNTLLLIEQPELHLHPRLQAELADILIESTTRGNRLLIETHSEHLLARLQRRMREGTFNANDVHLYYISSNGPSGATAQRIHFTESGEMIEAWPAGFFDEQFEDLFGSEDASK